MLTYVLLGIALTVVADGSANGALYICDTAKLTSENLCYFVASDTNTVGASPHNINMAVAANGYRKVVDVSGNDLSVMPKPWTQGDMRAASATELTGDLLAYAKAFEMVAPLRDAMMYAPNTISTDATKWAEMTKMFTDCKVKENDKMGDHGTAYSVANIYNKLKDPQGKDIHHNVLQFLEEGTIDLVCLMTALSMERCDDIRTTNNVPGTSTCWEAAYEAMYSSGSTSSVTSGSSTSGTLADASSGAPASSPSDAPASSPSGTPASSPSGAPASTPSDTPKKASSSAPVNSPSGTPKKASSGAPASSPSGAPKKASSGAPANSPSGAPASSPSGTPKKASSGAPASSPSGTPKKSFIRRTGKLPIRRTCKLPIRHTQKSLELHIRRIKAP